MNLDLANIVAALVGAGLGVLVAPAVLRWADRRPTPRRRNRKAPK